MNSTAPSLWSILFPYLTVEYLHFVSKVNIPASITVVLDSLPTK